MLSVLTLCFQHISNFSDFITMFVFENCHFPCLKILYGTVSQGAIKCTLKEYCPQIYEANLTMSIPKIRVRKLLCMQKHLGAHYENNIYSI